LLRHAGAARDVVWLGWRRGRDRVRGYLGGPQGRVTYASIDFDQGEYQDFYLGFCNATLWPLFH
jgi:trehalose-6-phosphate synthase